MKQCVSVQMITPVRLTQKPSVQSRVPPMRIVSDKVTLDQVFLPRSFWFPLSIIIPAVLHSPHGAAHYHIPSSSQALGSSY